jgi:hypothetical protein
VTFDGDADAIGRTVAVTIVGAGSWVLRGTPTLEGISRSEDVLSEPSGATGNVG